MAQAPVSPDPTLSTLHPTRGDEVPAALTALYNWNYDSEIDTLRTLYANALERQWIALRDLDWSREIDREAFSNTFSMGGIPIQETGFWQGLDPQTRWEMSRRTAAFMLSNFLHGEQGALMVAAQLVNAVPHMDGKFYAATQTLDEARHVEVFAAYIRKLDEVQLIAPALKQLLDGVLTSPSWLTKAVGMQVVTEGIALYSFRDMRNTTREPLLKEMLTYVSRDEARHTGFGVKYLAAVVPNLNTKEIQEVEDFAFEAARLLIDSRAGLSMRDSVMSLWSQAGVDPKSALAEIAKDRGKVLEAIQRNGGRRGPVRGFVIPTLRAIGLFSDRIKAHFEEMFVANVGPQWGKLRDDEAGFPEDLEAWVESS